jgi:hypothetical protein
MAGPVALRAEFRLPKPASAPKRLRTWPIKARSGDVDKLARACLDALTGVLFADDAQVISLMVTKDWAVKGPGLWLEVWAVGETVGVGGSEFDGTPGKEQLLEAGSPADSLAGPRVDTHALPLLRRVAHQEAARRGTPARPEAASPRGASRPVGPAKDVQR